MEKVSWKQISKKKFLKSWKKFLKKVKKVFQKVEKSFWKSLKKNKLIKWKMIFFKLKICYKKIMSHLRHRTI